MSKFNLAELPRELGMRQDPIVRVDSGAIYIDLYVFSRSDPTDIVDFRVLVPKKSAERLAHDLAAAIAEVT